MILLLDQFLGSLSTVSISYKYILHYAFERNDKEASLFSVGRGSRINLPSQFAAIFLRMSATLLKQSLEVPLEQYPVKAARPRAAGRETVDGEFRAERALGGRRRQRSGRLMMLPGHSGRIPWRSEGVSRSRRRRRWGWRRRARRTLARWWRPATSPGKSRSEIG